MPDLENRLRRALQAEAKKVRPELIRSYGTDSPTPVARSGQFRWSRLAGPIAVACAVLAVIAGTTLAGRSPASGPGAKVSTASAPSRRSAPSRPAATLTDVPSFVAVNHGSSLAIVSTRTGAAVGTLRAPAGLQFDGLASGGASQTFLAYANPVTGPCHAFYYRFGLAASGTPSALTLIRSIPGSAASAIAANPGGGNVTYSAVHCVTAPPNGLIGISGPLANHSWAYDTGDDYTFSLAETANADTLALSLFVYGPGWQNLLLNTHSGAATVDGASRVLSAVPYAQTLAISPDGATLYACISNGRKGDLGAYSTATGNLIRDLHHWTLPAASSYFCQVSADATGKVLLATYSSDRIPRTRLIGIDPQTGAAMALPVRGDQVHDGVEAAW